MPRLAVSVMRGKERRLRRADVGVGGEQLALGGANVGAPLEQVRRQAGRNVDRDLLDAERQRRRQVGRQRLADEQLQGVLVEGALAQRLGERRLRAFELRLGLAVVELRARAGVEAQLVDAGRLLARRQRLARDAQLLFVGKQRQVGVGDRRDEADLDRLAGLCGREVLRQRCIAQVVDAAEQVELVAGDGEADCVHRRDAVADRRARRRPTDADRWKLVGAADLVDRARLLDVEDGDAQVAVVGERELDQALQARVGEEALPVDVGGGLGAGCGRRRDVGGIGRRHRRGGPLVLRHQRRARRERQRRDGERGARGQGRATHGRHPWRAARPRPDRRRAAPRPST